MFYEKCICFRLLKKSNASKFASASFFKVFPLPRKFNRFRFHIPACLRSTLPAKKLNPRPSAPKANYTVTLGPLIEGRALTYLKHIFNINSRRDVEISKSDLMTNIPRSIFTERFCREDFPVSE